jgi:hypothetical protein
MQLHNHKGRYFRLAAADTVRVPESFEAMELPSQPGLTMLVYTAPPGTPTSGSLKLLASWAATAEQTGALALH